MSFDDRLRAARTSTAVVFDQFIRKYTRPGYLHLFFEGSDDISFYSGFIEQYVPIERIETPYICNGKEGVFEAYEKISQRLTVDSRIASAIKVIFFVDKDHSDIANDDYPTADVIFVTGYYSIENYIVTDYMFRRVWQEYYHFEGEANKKIPEYEQFRLLFLEQLRRFHELMLPIMAWSIVTRQNGIRIQLNRLDLDSLFRFDNNLYLEAKIRRKYASQREALEKMCDVATPDDAETHLNKMIIHLKSIDEPKMYVRGKFEVWFFSKFVKKLAEKFQERSDVRFRFRNQLHIEPNQIVHSLGPRTQMPEHLKEFLERHLLNFPPPSEDDEKNRLL